MGGLHSRPHGGGSFLARCGQDTSAETGQSDIVCRFYPDKYVFWQCLMRNPGSTGVLRARTS